VQQWEEAIQTFEELFSVAQSTDNLRGQAIALYGWGQVADHQGKYQQARAFIDQALDC
jgi:tetratricopeptide (TPR) repeat protein